MGHYFERCRQDNIPVDDAYITDLYLLFRRLFNCDFSPDGPFWAKAGMAYKNWHALQPANGNVHIRFVKEPMHGEPFLLAQMKKSFTHATPRGISNTPFWPAPSDLW